MGSRRAQQQVILERLPSLLRDVYEGRLLLPEADRPSWDDERRLRLLESIYRGLPIGSITIWRTAQRLKHQRLVGEIPLLEPKATLTRDYLVDGIGRIKTLFEIFGMAFWRSDKSSRRRSMHERPTSQFVFELQTQTFRIKQEAETNRKTEFPLTALFDASRQHEFLDRIRKLRGGEQLANHLAYCVSAFFDCEVAAITFVTNDSENIQALLDATRSPSTGTTPSSTRTVRWYCDTCSQPVEHPSDGWIEFLLRLDALGKVEHGLKLVHQASASPLPNGCQYDEALARQNKLKIEGLRLTEMLGPDGLVNWLVLRDMNDIPPEELDEMLQRLHIPGYERARFHAAAAIAQHVIEPMHGGPGLLTQDEIAAILKWADAQGLKP